MSAYGRFKRVIAGSYHVPDKHVIGMPIFVFALFTLGCVGVCCAMGAMSVLDIKGGERPVFHTVHPPNRLGAPMLPTATLTTETQAHHLMRSAFGSEYQKSLPADTAYSTSPSTIRASPNLVDFHRPPSGDLVHSPLTEVHLTQLTHDGRLGLTIKRPGLEEVKGGIGCLEITGTQANSEFLAGDIIKKVNNVIVSDELDLKRALDDATRWHRMRGDPIVVHVLRGHHSAQPMEAPIRAEARIDAHSLASPVSGVTPESMQGRFVEASTFRDGPAYVGNTPTRESDPSCC